jgi:3-phosphoshikimate 1-carboxyvinyltransferase
MCLDELPCLFAAAAVAEGDTVVTGAGELRVKESDRLAAMSAGLNALDVAVELFPDGLRVRGGAVAGGTVDSRGDHRVAMSFAVLAARARSPIRIRDVRNVSTSYPDFAASARDAGLQVVEVG